MTTPNAPPPVTHDDDIVLLQEMLREGERVLDVQARAAEELNTKAEHMIGLGVASIGAAAALAAYMADKVCGWPGLVLVGIGLGAAVNIYSVRRFVKCYIGDKDEIALDIPPATDWLVKKATDDDWTLLKHYIAVIQGIDRSRAANQAQARILIEHRRAGLRALIAALGIYGATVIAFATVATTAMPCP